MATDEQRPCVSLEWRGVVSNRKQKPFRHGPDGRGYAWRARSLVNGMGTTTSTNNTRAPHAHSSSLRSVQMEGGPHHRERFSTQRLLRQTRRPHHQPAPPTPTSAEISRSTIQISHESPRCRKLAPPTIILLTSLTSRTCQSLSCTKLLYLILTNHDLP